MGNKLNYKQALIEEIIAWRPELFTVEHLELLDEINLKATLDKICEGRL